MTQIKLFYSPGACSLAPHIVLEEIGAPYELVRLALHKGEQRTPEYLKINPKGRVPALVEDGWALTETQPSCATSPGVFPRCGCGRTMHAPKHAVPNGSLGSPQRFTSPLFRYDARSVTPATHKRFKMWFLRASRPAARCGAKSIKRSSRGRGRSARPTRSLTLTCSPTGLGAGARHSGSTCRATYPTGPPTPAVWPSAQQCGGPLSGRG